MDANIREQVKKCRHLAGTVRNGFYRLDAVKNIPYKREVLNIQELAEELDRLESMTREEQKPVEM